MFTLKHPTIDIGIVCSDFEMSLHFYHDLLGLEIALDIQNSQRDSDRSVSGTNGISSGAAQGG